MGVKGNTGGVCRKLAQDGGCGDGGENLVGDLEGWEGAGRDTGTREESGGEKGCSDVCAWL